jgi:hypothetical protein
MKSKTWTSCHMIYSTVNSINGRSAATTTQESPMPGQTLSLDIKHASVWMSHFFTPALVAALLGISVRSVQHAIRQHNDTGNVGTLLTRTKRGQKPKLEDDDLVVSNPESQRHG